VQLAYEYGYGFDGGRRWRKDYLNGVWTRYPCGVACGAGELVEQTSDLSGSQWTVSALYLQGISLVRRNNEWHHFDPLGTAGVITNGSAQVVSNNLYDVFGVLRHQQGSAETPWRLPNIAQAEENMFFNGSSFLLRRDQPVLRPLGVPPWLLACGAACGLLLWRLLKFWEECRIECIGQHGIDWAYCMAGCLLRKVCREGRDGPISQALCAACSACVLVSVGGALKPTPVPVPVPVPVPAPTPIPVPVPIPAPIPIPCLAFGGIAPARACAVER
jgi:hypothetical protein